MKSFVQAKLIRPLLELLKRGANPSQLALAVSLGIVIGFVPVFGICTILCLAAVAIFKVNPAAILIANQFAYPLQFILYFPLVRMGEWLFSQQPIPFSFEQIAALFDDNFLNAISVVGWSTLSALAVWFVMAWPVAYILHLFFKIIFRTIARKNSGHTSHGTT